MKSDAGSNAEMLAAAAGASPLAAEFNILAGNAAFLNGRMDRATLDFRQADSQVPLGESDRFMLALALANLGDTKGAREQFTRLNNSRPNRPLYLYWLARVDYFERRYLEAVEKLKRVIVLDPASARAYDNLGLGYDMLGKSEEAREALLTAVDLNRKLPTPSAWPPDNLGYLLLRLRQLKEAETALRESLRYDPRFATAHYHLGRTLEAEDRDTKRSTNTGWRSPSIRLSSSRSILLGCCIAGTTAQRKPRRPLPHTSAKP